MIQSLKIWLSNAVCLLTVMPALMLCGCGSSNSEDEHHAHVIPAHRPEFFPDAVETIEKSLSELDSWTKEQHEELRDIIVWLPELAAETDLKKADWDSVNAISKQLNEAYSQLIDQSPKQQIESHLDELKRIAAKAIEVDSFNTYQNNNSKVEETTKDVEKESDDV